MYRNHEASQYTQYSRGCTVITDAQTVCTTASFRLEAWERGYKWTSLFQSYDNLLCLHVCTDSCCCRCSLSIVGRQGNFKIVLHNLYIC